MNIEKNVPNIMCSMNDDYFESFFSQLEEDLNTIESFVFPALNADSECEPAIFTLLSDKQTKCKEIFTVRGT